MISEALVTETDGISSDGRRLYNVLVQFGDPNTAITTVHVLATSHSEAVAEAKKLATEFCSIPTSAFRET